MILEEAQIRVPIAREEDLITARRNANNVAAAIGFSERDLAAIAIAIAEVARNTIAYGGGGDILLVKTEKGDRRGITIIARDRGPGIPDIEAAMRDGFSTGKGLGFGLPSAKRLMDEFEIVSKLGQGTTVTMRKWAS
jgi:serine/threonine-protein kinase RsbT